MLLRSGKIYNGVLIKGEKKNEAFQIHIGKKKLTITFKWKVVRYKMHAYAASG